MSKEAMKLALEALEKMAQLTGARWALENSYAGHLEAITALREALAEQPARPYRLLQDNGSKYFGDSWDKPEQPAQQEPVATCSQEIIHAITMYGDARADQDANNAPTTSHERLADCIRLMRKALAEPAQQEPVAWMYPDDYERMTTSETFCTVYSVEVGSATRGETTVALYTSPPAQRTWVGLTNNELQPIADEYRILFGSWVEDFARAIEAKLRSKNNG